MNEKQKRFLRNIQEAGDHLLDLINAVLDLSKVEAGRLGLRPEIVTLELLREPVAAAARTAAQAKGVLFTMETPDAPPLFLDPTGVRQVLFNLISNAVKFTGGGGHITLRVFVEDRELRFEVADTGVGIPKEALDRVFGVFERFHEGRTDAAGTGLGLALSKRLVEQMNGAIDFETEEGTGTTFRVQLRDVVTQQVQGLRILLVEDDQMNVELFESALETDGHEIVTERDGAAGEERASDRFDLVLLDIQLPKKDGLEVCRRLRARGLRIPIVALSASVLPEEIARTKAAGFDLFLSKPISPRDLREAVRRLGPNSRAANGR